MDNDENTTRTPAAPSAEPASGTPVATATRPRRRFRLRRSPTDVMLAGVCAGLAEELDLDPALVRIAMVVLAVLTSGLAAVAYVAAWMLAPVEAAV